MDRETAAALVAEYVKYGEIMARLYELADKLPPAEKKRVIDADSEACFALYDGIVKTVTKYFPELEPTDHQLKKDAED